MYGMVNQAVRGLVLEKFGEACWTDIHTRAGSPSTFLNFEKYDDAITYNLVGAASEVLELPAETVLRVFGQYWVASVATKAYADLMDRTGVTFLDFLKGLDHMHSRIKVSFPDYRPPSFRVKVVEDGRLQLDYYSEREGLMPFVEGLLEGVAEYFAHEITMEGVPDEAHGMPCKRVMLTYRPKAAE